MTLRSDYQQTRYPGDLLRDARLRQTHRRRRTTLFAAACLLLPLGIASLLLTQQPDTPQPESTPSITRNPAPLLSPDPLDHGITTTITNAPGLAAAPRRSFSLATPKRPGVSLIPRPARPQPKETTDDNTNPDRRTDPQPDARDRTAHHGLRSA
ncbi:hypothetical protein [Mucisphaera calidilacus]|uniref:hypothetical protein n=1 Tax=Mucisphaera calidilacus TaxID=2527982 RepID=UPI0011A089B9|nr:hypothetical protein [Mucisphaera calidilacus]